MGGAWRGMGTSSRASAGLPASSRCPWASAPYSHPSSLPSWGATCAGSEDSGEGAARSLPSGRTVCWWRKTPMTGPWPPWAVPGLSEHLAHMNSLDTLIILSPHFTHQEIKAQRG